MNRVACIARNITTLLSQSDDYLDNQRWR